MSSYASATTASSSEYPLDKNESPPSYNQVLDMNEIPTAPLLSETYSGIFGNATNLKFEWNGGSGGGRGEYTFLIRDTVGCLHAKGTVANLNTTLINANGMEILKVRKNSDTSSVNGLIIHMFEIYHKNAHIGSVIYLENSPLENCLKIIQNGVHHEIIVRSLNLGDFAIFRDKMSTTPLCNIQLPNPNAYIENEFNGTIIFHPETQINAQEQLLCTAAAISFKVSTKHKADDESGWLGYAMGILCVLVVFGVFAIAFAAIKKSGCESKKAKGFAGYRDADC